MTSQQQMAYPAHVSNNVAIFVGILVPTLPITKKYSFFIVYSSCNKSVPKEGVPMKHNFTTRRTLYTQKLPKNFTLSLDFQLLRICDLELTKCCQLNESFIIFVVFLVSINPDIDFL